MARAAMEVLNTIKEACVDKKEWLRQLREASGFTGNDSELLKAISAYHAAYAQRINIRSGKFRSLAEGAGQQRRDVMSVKDLTLKLRGSGVRGISVGGGWTNPHQSISGRGPQNGKCLSGEIHLRGHDPNYVRGGWVHRPRHLAIAGSVCPDKEFEIRVVGSTANVTFVRNAKQAEDGHNSAPVVEELSRHIKELESKLEEHEKEKVHQKPSEEAVETLLRDEGVPKWIEKLGAALIRLFREPTEPEGLKLIQLLSNEVWATIWDTKESYASKYHQKSKDGQEAVGRNSKSQGSRSRKKHDLSVEQMLDKGGKKYREKARVGYF